VLHEGAPAVPLWDCFSDDLACDHGSNLLGNVSTPAKDLALQDIQQLLQEHGKSSEDFALPKVTTPLLADIRAELKYFAPHIVTLATLVQSNVCHMTHDQLQLYTHLHSIIFSVHTPPHPLLCNRQSWPWQIICNGDVGVCHVSRWYHDCDGLHCPLCVRH
jgi:hypothetical protein